MTTTPDTSLDTAIDDDVSPAFELDHTELLDLDDSIAIDADLDARVDPAVMRLADTELLGPDDTHLGIVEVELLPVDVHDDLEHTLVDLDQLDPVHDDPVDPFTGLDLDFGVG